MIDQKTILAWYIFIEDPRTKLSRDTIREFQIHLTLLKQYPVFLSAEEIATNIKSHPGCFSMPERTIESALNCSLKRTPPLIIKAGSGYQLTEPRKAALEKAHKSYDEYKRIFEDHIISTIEQEFVSQLKERDKHGIKAALEPILVEFFNKRVLELDRVRSVPTYTMDASFEKTQLEEWEEVMDKYLVNIDVDLTKGAVIRAGIKNALSNIPTDAKRYIAAVHNKVFCAKFSMPDPAIIQLEKRMLSERRLYLDTSVIIDALFEGSTEHNICKELIDRCNDFKIQLFISDFTKEELDRQREKAKKHYLLFEQKKPDFLASLKRTGGPDILRTYLSRKLSNPSLTIDSFLSIYDPWENFLLEKGILLESEFCEKVKEIPESEREIVYKHIKESKTKNFEPRHEAIDHDVNEFLLGHLLREKYPHDKSGSRVWIITSDRATATKGQKYLKFKYPKPIFKLVEEWLERLLYVSTVDIEGISIEKYIDLIVNTELGAIYEDQSFDIDFTATLLDSNLPIDDLRSLPPDYANRAISRLQSDKEVEQLIMKAKTVSSEELPKIHDLFREKLLKAVHDEKESTKKVDLINAELKELREDVQLLTETINSLGKEVETKEVLIRNKDEDIEKMKKNLSDLKKVKKYMQYGYIALALILLLVLIFIMKN